MAKIHKAIAGFFFSNNVKNIHVCGNSMQPLLSNGQAVKVLPLQLPVIPGKCYIFICNGVLRIHRLLKIKKGKVIFIGDTSQKLDSVPFDAIIAELDSKQNIFVILVLRYINLFFNKAITIYPKCTKLRVKVIRCIVRCERFFYERKV